MFKHKHELTRLSAESHEVYKIAMSNWQRTGRVFWFAVALMLWAAFFATPRLAAQNPPEMQRIPFQIGTGPVSGSYLPLGEAIAFVISHPPGLGRCSAADLCGPEGLIATTRSSSGSVSNAQSVERGNVQSALVQGDIAAAAVAGSGPFAETGALKDLRAIARLHDEALHIVASSRSRVKRFKDLAGKRVAIDSSNSATEFTFRNVLSAARVKFSAIKVRRVALETAATQLRDGKVDVIVLIGMAPVAPVDQLMRRGYGRLIGLESKTIQRLSRKNSAYSKVTLAAGTYRSSKAVSTLGVASFWLVNKDQKSTTISQILRAFWQAENQAELKKRGRFAATIERKKAALVSSVPLHEGARRFYAIRR